MVSRIPTLTPRTSSLLLSTLVALGTVGCDAFDDDHHTIVESPVDRVAPAAPQGLVSVTGDREVRLDWMDNTEPDLAEYRIYWSPTELGAYQFMATARTSSYVDHDVQNGVTYFYAVTAVDVYDNESELSVETVHDTPRPEGYNLVLWNYLGDQAALSGFDFSDYSRRPYDFPDTDVFFGYDGVRYAMLAADPLTDLQDAGYVDLDDLDWAPPAGWSTEDRVTLIEGHSYYVWTRNDHFAKFQVVSLSSDRVVVDWAYQIDKANPELIAPRGGE